MQRLYNGKTMATMLLVLVALMFYTMGDRVPVR